MKVSRVFVALAVVGLIFAAVPVFAEEAEAESDVFVLTDDNFDQTLADNEWVLVKFYAPWCGHCKNMAEDYKKAATELKGSALLAELDGTVHKTVAGKFEIKGFPTLKIFHNGEFVADHKGARTKDSLISFVQRSTQPPARQLETAADVTQFLSDNADKKAVIGLYTAGSSAFAKFEAAAREVAESVNDAVFAWVNSDELFTAAGGDATNHPAVVVRAGAETTNADVSSGDVSKKILLQLVPLVGNFGADTAALYQKLGLPLLIAFTKTDEIPQALYAGANAGRGKISAVTVDGVKYSKFADHVGLGEGPFPAFLIHELAGDVSYLLPERGGDAATDEAVAAHVTRFVAGELRPTVKSEPVPASNDAAVKVVVGDTWDSIVMDPERDVLIEQYAPWCGHCKKLEPIYTELAESLAGVPTLTIAKMDATKNDAPAAWKARSFPTIYFFPAGSKEGVKYTGERTKAGFTKYLQEKVTHKFEVPAEETKDEL